MKRKLDESWWITLMAIFFISLIQFLIFFVLYQRHTNFFADKMKVCVNAAIKEFNMKNLNLTDGVISYKSDDTLIIQRNGKQFLFKVDEKLGLNNSVDRAIYDIRVLEAWKLGEVANIFQRKIGLDFVPYTFILTDSVEKCLDYYGIKGGERFLKKSYSIPLGFLDGHRLIVFYSFPLKYFWMLEGKNFLVSLAVQMLIATCIFLLFRIIHQNKESLENQELFLQAVNHDLKSPLNDLQMKLYLIKKQTAAPFTVRQEELYQAARIRIEKLLDSIHKLLQDSIDYEGLCLNPEVVNLPTLLQQLAGDWQKTIRSKKQVSVQLCFREKDIPVRIDVYHLSRAICNLLENAVKYSGEKVEIDLSVTRIGRYVEISVKDNGQGIEKCDLKNIFKRSYRSLKNKALKIEGYGLGLSYVRMIVKAHKGKVWVNSESGKGSDFVIRLKMQ